MSVQSEFYKALFDELIARGVSEEVAEENVLKFKQQLSERAESEEYIDAALSKIPPSSIAENIYNMIRAENDEASDTKSEVMVIDTESDTVETTIKEGTDALSPLSEENAEEFSEDAQAENSEDEAQAAAQADESVEKATEEAEEAPAEDIAEEEPAAFTEDDAEFTYSFSDDDDFQPLTDSESNPEEAESEQETAEAEKAAPEEEAEEEEDLSIYSPANKRLVNKTKKNNSSDNNALSTSGESVDLFMEDDNKNSWVFIVMAVFLIPLFFIIGAAAFAVVLALWLALAVVIAVLLLALAGIVVAGTAYSVLGLIFGIIEAFSGNPAAAVFEVGLALCVGGLVMFVGIWVYNFAVRFIPFIIRKLGVLLILIFRLFKTALIKLKALCLKI